LVQEKYIRHRNHTEDASCSNHPVTDSVIS